VSDRSSTSTECVDHDEISSAFRGEKIERDGVVVDVEMVRTASNDPRDDDARYTFDVRARSVDTATEE